MAFDKLNSTTVLFGGVSPTGLHDDTWTFDGYVWRLQHPAHHPGVRQGASMDFDPRSGRVILFGGNVAEGLWLNETWAWQGNDWTQLDAPGPAARSGASLVFDADRNALVLIGGGLGNVTFFGDEWQWTGTGWRRLAGENSPPVAFAAAAYDPTRSAIVMFGGTVHGPGGVGSIGEPTADTWVERNGAWTKRPAASGPTARYSSVAVFDWEARGVVLFGGAACPKPDAGLWWWAGTLDGATWVELQSAAKPTPRFAATAVYDSARHFVVLFGGSNEQVCF
jgi:hypothetical protein